jgi:glutamate decarboxylase
MTNETIECDLESYRTEELESLLRQLEPRILNYISKADPNREEYQQDSLGRYHSPQFLKEKFTDDAQLQSGIRKHPQQVFDVIDKVLEYSVNTWNPGFLDKLYASNNPIGVVSDIILSVLNTNSHVYTVSPVLSVLENYIGKKYAGLFFKNHRETCGGLTFSGGSWSNVTSLQMARAMKYPDTKVEGNNGRKFAIYSSKHCHYSVEKAAILLGLGSGSLFKVDILEDGTMDVASLKQAIAKSKLEGYIPLYVNATAGTTVFGSYDPFEEIAAVAKEHDLWFHIDGSWGGNVIFSPSHSAKLKGSELADSITVNPHKMLGVPTTCSFLLVPHVVDFQNAMSLSAPYLFHGRESELEENFDLADGTMGCGRRADSFKFYMAWIYFGHNGFAKRVDHAFDIAKRFVELISADRRFELVLGSPENPPPCLQVCFYFRPAHWTDEDHSDVTRYISRELHKQGKYLVDFSPNAKPGQEKKGEFFRVVFNSPILTDKVVADLVNSIVEIGEHFGRERK